MLKTLDIAIRTIVAIGALFRLVQFGASRSLWLDEAMIGLNVAQRDFGELLKPLNYEQVAPVLFLWLERVAYLIGGPNERALRALPVLSGILLPLSVIPIARRYLSARWCALMLLLLAVSPYLIRYANEVKPYAFDPLLAAVVLAAAFRCAEDLDDQVAWRRLFIASLVAALLSIGCVFVLLPVTALLLWEGMHRSNRQVRVNAIVLLVVWALPFGILYLLNYRYASRGEYMQQFWRGAFLSIENIWPVSRGWLSSLLVGTLSPSRWGRFVTWATASQAAAAAILSAVGVGALVRRRDRVGLALLVGPILCLGVASLARLFPISPRLTLFLVPAVALLIVLGTEVVAARTHKLAGVMLVAFLLVPASARAVIEARAPHRRQDVRPLIELLKAQAPWNEPVYISVAALPAWVFYTTDWWQIDHERLQWFAWAGGSKGPAFHSRTSRGRPVGRESDDLRRFDGTNPEIIGTASGRRRVTSSGFAFSDRIDDGWAANEARRINASGTSVVWLLYVNESLGYDDPALAALVQHLEQGGAVVTKRFEAADADLLRIHLNRQQFN